MKKILLSLLCSLAFQCIGYAQNKCLASYFVNPDVTVEQVNTLASVSLFNTATLSIKAEGLMAEQIMPYGTQYIPTSDAIHQGTKLDRDRLKAYLEATKAEYVLVMKLLPYGPGKEKITVPLYINDNPKDPRYISESSRRVKSDNFYSDLYPAYQLTGKQDTWSLAKYIRVQFTVVDIESGTTIWSGFSNYMKTKKLDQNLPVLMEEVVEAIHNKQLI